MSVKGSNLRRWGERTWGLLEWKGRRSWGSEIQKQDDKFSTRDMASISFCFVYPGAQPIQQCMPQTTNLPHFVHYFKFIGLSTLISCRQTEAKPLLVIWIFLHSVKRIPKFNHKFFVIIQPSASTNVQYYITGQSKISSCSYLKTYLTVMTLWHSIWIVRSREAVCIYAEEKKIHSMGQVPSLHLT